jgi:diketogulonate reductase-like aldo/keto reductase
MYGGKEAILAQLEQTLKDLQTDYLDSYLVHWPVPGKPPSSGITFPF